MAYLRYLVFGLVVLGACVEDPGAVQCPSGIICPSGTTCAAAQPVCIVNSCGNGVRDTGEACDDGNISVGDGCSPACTLESCGDGVQVAGERCDDGNTTSGDGCSADCLSVETCGNSIKDVNEACDDGNTISGDGCSSDCKSAEICGNGIKDVDETCDDGNTVGGDACSPNCEALAGCRNGVIDVDQNGVPVEECDDGNNMDNDNCRNNCKRAVCGDGVEASLATGGAFEQCDGGTLNGSVAKETADCNIDCTDIQCGDGKVNQSAGEQCDNGTLVDSASCDMNNCSVPVCGDNHTNTAAGETCDPGTIGANVLGCDSDCTAPSCGDNHVNPAASEQCEDGNTVAGDGCSACQLEPFALNVIKAGNGTGTVTSNVTGINCGNDCTEIYAPNSVVILTAAPAANQVFSGWTGACTSASNTCTVTMTAAASVTATFEANRLTITKSGAGTGAVATSGGSTGINCGADCTQDYPVPTSVQITATPSGDSVFSSWTGACAGQGAVCTLTMDQPRATEAVFALDNFTLTVSKGASTGTGLVTSGPAGIDCGATCSASFVANTAVTLVANPDSSSTFTGWSGTGISCPGTGNCTVTMSQSRTVTATFTIKSFQLSVTKSGNGTGTVTSSPGSINCGGTCSGNFSANAMVTLTATPTTKNFFVGWSGACTGTGACVVTMDSAKAVTATFVINRLTVVRAGDGSGSVTSSPSGINCGNNCTEDYVVGTGVTLTATASAGSRFAGWSEASCGTASTCAVTMNGPLTVTATFVDLDNVDINFLTGTGSVVSSPAGLSCTADCNADFDDGTTIILTATPTAPSTGVLWGGDCAGATTATTCTITNLTTNRNITITFTGP